MVGTILQVYPYGSDDPEDTELQELMEYLESFLEQPSRRRDPFTSTLLRNWREEERRLEVFKDGLRQQFQSVLQARGAMGLPASLDARQRAAAHTVAEEAGLHHQSVGEGDERFIRVWFADAQ